MNYVTKHSLFTKAMRRDDDGVLLFLAVLTAPLMMLVASMIEKRLGPAAGGWVAALPFALAVTLAAVGWSEGTATFTRLAASSAAHVPADIVFAVAGAFALRRWGLAAGIAAAVAGYAGAAFLLAFTAAPAGMILAALLLIVAPMILPAPTRRGEVSTAPRFLITTVSCVVTLLAVLAAVAVTQQLGPAVGGAAAAYPAVTTILTIVVTTRDGRRRGAQVLVGLTRSMVCYYIFAVTVTLTAPILGMGALLVAVVTGAAAAVVSALLMRRSTNRAALIEANTPVPAVPVSQ